MTVFWRISNYPDLTGEGGRITSARWHTKGKPVVYLAENPTGAMLERIVYLMDMNEYGNLPRTYNLIQVTVPDEVVIKQLNALAPTDWRENQKFTRSIGDAWLVSLETPVARVPSAIVPHTWNYLLNPEHPDAKQVQIVEVIHERFDNRLFRFGPR